MSQITMYRCGDILVYPLPGDSALVYSRDTRARQICSNTAIDLLLHCQNFRTLDEHVETYILKLRNRQAETANALFNLSNELWPPAIISFLHYLERISNKVREANLSKTGRRKLLMTELLQLVQAGFLVSNSIQDVQHTPDEVATITTVGIVTRNRTDSLGRCLSSYLKMSQDYQREILFVVMDNSDTCETRNCNKSIIKALHPKTTCKISYAGLEEKQHFVKILNDCGDFDPEIIDFAFFDTEECGRMLGANRNALLLKTAGELILSIDDDTTCEFATVPDCKDVLTLHGGGDLTKFWFFENRESLLNTHQFSILDPLAMHEQMLGKSAIECLAKCKGERQTCLENASPVFLRHIRSGLAKVMTTQPGLAGDCATWSPHGYLTLQGESYNRLVSSEAEYRAYCVSREVLRSPDSYTISERAFCMAYNLGLDNRNILPPFFPVLRNSDGLFATIVRKCIPYGYLGFLPWAVRHHPLETRSYLPTDIWENVTRSRMCDILLACIHSFTFEREINQVEDNIRTLGTYLISLGSASHSDFEDFFQVTMLKSKAGYLKKLEARLNIYKDGPSYWIEDVNRQIDALQESIIKSDHLTPIDLTSNDNIANPQELAQRLVYKFGKLLCCWPDIISVAKHLRFQGYDMAVDVFD
jgi:hypothetical protein